MRVVQVHAFLGCNSCLRIHLSPILRSAYSFSPPPLDKPSHLLSLDLLELRIPVLVADNWARFVLEETESAAEVAQVCSDWSRHRTWTFHCRSGGGRLGLESCFVLLKLGRWWFFRLNCITECHLLSTAGGSFPRPRGTRPAHRRGQSWTQIWGFWWGFSPLLALLLFLPIAIALVGGMIYLAAVPEFLDLGQ